VTEFKPSQIRVGKEIRVPPPATELMAPAAKRRRSDGGVEQTERGHRRSEDAALEAFESEFAVSAMAMTAMTRPGQGR